MLIRSIALISTWIPCLLIPADAGAEYKSPVYARAEPALEAISITAAPEAQAGGKLSVTFTATMKRPPLKAPGLFVYLVLDEKVLHVASFAVATRNEQTEGPLPIGRQTTLGPFEIPLPETLPDGDYRLVAGMHIEPVTTTRHLTVRGKTPSRPPLIITTGIFTDKFGVPHRWHINKAHTLFWDGEAYLPVGGMLIPDPDIESFKAQIDLLVRNNVRDIYFNVGSSIQMPRTWETKSDEQMRLFQQCVDYMDEVGMRYGMQASGLQAHGYAHDLMSGDNVEIDIDQGKPLGLNQGGDNRWIKEGRLHVYSRKTRDALYVISDRTTGQVVAHGKAGIVPDDREGKPKGDEHTVARIDLSDLPPGRYTVSLCPARYRERWNDNMYFWTDETQKYYQSIRDLYGKIRMGPGFRFVVDAFWNENNMDHSIVPSDARFRLAFRNWLEARYGTIGKLQAAWALENDFDVPDFDTAANLVPIRAIDDKQTGQSWAYLINVESGALVRCLHGIGQHRYDVMESVGRQVRDFHNEVANVFKSLHDVPVIFKCFSGMDWWHINDAGIGGGFDGLGMESYGVGEPMLTFMGIPPFGECKQSTKTMWLVATEIGEGNHQDQSLSRNKLFGCTSRLGTMYPIYASLISGGAKGLFHYYMMPSPGVDQFWSDAVARDPRQLEWLGTFAEIVHHAPGVVDYEPTVYYRFPGLFHPNSGLLYSDPYRDYTNTDTLWWVDPAGKLPNGAWLLPTFSLDVPTDMMFINIENAPASLRYAEQVEAHIKSGRRVTWLGYRKDLGTMPRVDAYYTDAFATHDDGIKFQVLKPTPSCRIIGRNDAGRIWNMIDGNLQIISKSAENQPGWRPDGVVLDGKNYRFDYQAFMSDNLGAELQMIGPRIEQFTYVAGGERVTVISLAAAIDSTVTLGDEVPPYGLDGTGNVVPPPSMEETNIVIELPKGSSGPVRAAYAGGEGIQPDADGRILARLKPDRLTLVKSDRKFAWAPVGLLFDTARSRATVIIRTAASSPAPRVVTDLRQSEPTGKDGQAGLIVLEASCRAAQSNFNLDVFSGLAELGNDSLLGLASSCPPPAPDGYVVSLDFEVPVSGHYQFWVREGYLAMASPARWKIDDGPWHEAINRYVPVDIRLAAQYNALEDERMVFAWYHYANIELSAGKHRLSYSVIDKRPGGLDIGLARTMCYGKLLDQFVFCRGAFVPSDRRGQRRELKTGETLPRPRVNLAVNPSMEQDIGGWSAAEREDDRWKWVELRDDHGWDRDFWWTRKAPTAGRLRIKDLTDIGGLTTRHSYVGVRSLRIRAGDKPRRFAARPVAVEPGARIVFGGFLRAENLPEGAELRVRLCNQQGREVATTAADRVRGTTHWEQVESQPVETPAGALTAALECHVPPGDTGVAWFDDLYLYVDD